MYSSDTPYAEQYSEQCEEEGSNMKKKLCVLAISAMVMLTSEKSIAADTTVVFLSAGGSYQEAQEKSLVRPFVESNGLKLTSDSGVTGLVPRLRAQSDTKTVQWDVISAVEADYLALAKQGLLEPIDYSVFPKEVLDCIDPKYRQKYGIVALFFANGIAYRTEKNGGKHPTTWAEFWDTAKFPGPRALPTGASVTPPWEAALLAAGTASDKLYPLDLDKALTSLNKIKGDVPVWYDDIAVGMQALISGEVDYAYLPNGRVLQAKKQGAPVDFEYGQSFTLSDYFVVPKGAPHKDLAMKLVAGMSATAPSAEFMKILPYSTGNTCALKLLDPGYAKSMPTAAENINRQVPLTMTFYEENASNGQTWYTHSREVWNKWYGK